VGSVGFVTKNFEELVAGTFMLLMCLATFTNVIARYIFNESFQWAEEFSRYSFIWVVFIGAALCTKHKRHIVIDGFVLALPKRLTHLISSFVDLITIGFMLVLIYYGWVLCTFATQPTSTLKIPQPGLRGGAPVGNPDNHLLCQGPSPRPPCLHCGG